MMRIYEINTWTWLAGLSRQYGCAVSLATVPAAEWDELASWGFDAVWLMGVWERSPEGIEIARERQGLEPEYRRVLTDYQPADVVGSPYCIRRYEVDERFGGRAGLSEARRQLAERGMRLILDFVPNHTAPDHPWVTEHPEYYVAGSPEDHQRDPKTYFEAGGQVLARGRDPYFPAWPDTAQLNAFSAAMRRAVLETLWDIATQCDGVRCDMAMLLTSPVFERTWGARAGVPPSVEYWREIIPGVRSRRPDFLFIAEAYWDLEWELQQQGFDFCYDKRLLDRLEHDTPESVRLHLCAEMAYQEKLIRFLENHDEARAAVSLNPWARQKAAGLTAFTTPGAKLFHEGQLQGARVKLPVQLGRRPLEESDTEIVEFYRFLLKQLQRDVFHRGVWALSERWGYSGEDSFQNILAWSWTLGEERVWIIVNLSSHRSHAKVRFPWPEMTGTLVLDRPLHGAEHQTPSEPLRQGGLSVSLDPWAFVYFDVSSKE